MTDSLGDREDLASAFAKIKEAIDLSARGAGRDWLAEADIRAFRDGVPPSNVEGLTVGRGGATSVLDSAIHASMKGQASRCFAVVGRGGDGRSHLIRLASNLAERQGWATAELSEGHLARNDLALQQALLPSLRLRGRTVVQLLEDPAAKPTPPEASARIRELVALLTPGGTTALVGLSEAIAASRTARAVTVYEWLLGEPLETSVRRSLNLPASSRLAWNERGVLAAVLTVCRLLGALGLIILVDADRSADLEAPSWASVALPGLLLIGALPSAMACHELRVGPMSGDDRTRLARLIRDRHVAAYEWPSAEVVADRHLMPAVQAVDHGTVREWVRGVVATLDRTLASQGG